MRVFASNDRARAASREWVDLPLLTSTRRSAPRWLFTAGLLIGFVLGLLVH
jgi:hypothetical protein